MTNDERLIIQNLSKASGPVPATDLVHRISPWPARLDGRTRVGKAWYQRFVDLITATQDLHEAGLVDEVEILDPGPDGIDHGLVVTMEDETCPCCGERMTMGQWLDLDDQGRLVHLGCLEDQECA